MNSALSNVSLLNLFCFSWIKIQNVIGQWVWKSVHSSSPPGLQLTDTFLLIDDNEALYLRHPVPILLGCRKPRTQTHSSVTFHLSLCTLLDLTGILTLQSPPSTIICSKPLTRWEVTSATVSTSWHKYKFSFLFSIMRQRIKAAHSLW